MVVGGSATATPADPRLAAVDSFALALGGDVLEGDLVERVGLYDLIVLDGQGVTRAQIDALHRAGTFVLAYLSVGTIERSRPWFSAAKPYRLDYWQEWGEWYAAVSRSGFRHLIAERVAPGILAKGVDGLFLDNTDMVENHPRQARGMQILVRRLAALTHHRKRFLFTQNGESSISPTLSFYDGWNREGVTRTYDFDLGRYVPVPAAQVAAAARALRRIASRGLLVTATDYVEAGDGASEAEAIASACAAGALPFVSDIALTRIPSVPPTCP